MRRVFAYRTDASDIFVMSARAGINLRPVQSSPRKRQPVTGDSTMTDRDDGLNRRKVLECMTWAGTGVLWTVAGGVPTSLGIIDEAVAAQQKGFTFLQISDSHMGFDKPANPNAKGTLEEAIGRVKAMPVKAFVHDSHRRYFTSVQAIRIRRCRAHHLPVTAGCALRTGRTRPARRRAGQALSRPLRTREQGRRLVQLRCRRRAFHRSRQCG